MGREAAGLKASVTGTKLVRPEAIRLNFRSIDPDNIKVILIVNQSLVPPPPNI